MSGRFFRKTNIVNVVQKLTVKAVLERNLICEGDRILIAVSGGKDSTVLAWALALIRPALKINYELAACIFPPTSASAARNRFFHNGLRNGVYHSPIFLCRSSGGSRMGKR